MQTLKHSYYWHAIYTRSRSEKKLFNDLEIKGIDCYLPLKKELKVWSDRKKWVESPVFASYLFVRVNNAEYFEAINSIYAVKYVTFCGKAVRIPESQIEGLKSFLSDECRTVEVSHDKFKKGELLCVNTGPLKGIKGEIIETRGQHRLLLRFESLGSCVHAEISAAEVASLKA